MPLDAHDHDDRYYTETEAYAKFFHLDGGDTLPTGLDADTIDGQHATDLIGVALPVGAILPSRGSDADVPAGWVICNGANGTPDLRDKFVVGAGSSYSKGDTGGVAAVTPTGSINVATHIITEAEMPQHRHQYYDYFPGSTVKTNYLAPRCFVWVDLKDRRTSSPVVTAS